MKSNRRFVAALLVIAVCFVMLTSVCCLAAEANHQCTGEGCPVCYQLAAVHKTMQMLCLTAAVGIVLRFSDFAISALAKEFSRISLTPVALKVKISD